MKKLKKNQLKLDKEVISSLSENDLSVVKGGYETTQTMGIGCNETKDIKSCVEVCYIITKNNPCPTTPFCESKQVCYTNTCPITRP